MDQLIEITEQLAQNEWALIDNFLPPQEYQELCAYVQDSLAWQAATIGSKRVLQTNIRNDQICWLNEDDLHPTLLPYFTKIHTLRLHFNQTLFLGLQSIEAHFAFYPANHFYTKHTDQFINKSTRRISCVYYLNPSWQPEHAGSLIIYNQKEQIETSIDPIGNRFVCFKSNRLHEVQQTYHPRYSIAAWLKISI